MKIGDRVRFKIKPIYARWERTLPQGTVTALGDGYVTVRWDSGPTVPHDADVLTLADPFPYRSHRTMAEVLADEQMPEPA